MWSIWNWQGSSHVTNLKINRILYVKKKKLHEQDRATYVISPSQLVTSRGHWICFNHSLGTAALLGKVIRMSEKIRGSPGIFKSFRFITISSDAFITKGNQNKWNGCAKGPVKSQLLKILTPSHTTTRTCVWLSPQSGSVAVFLVIVLTWIAITFIHLPIW